MAAFAPVRMRLKGGEEVIVRAGVVTDALAVVEHRVHMAATSAHTVTEPGEVDQDVEKLRTWLAEKLERSYELFLVAFGAEDAASSLVLGALYFHAHNRRVLLHQGEFGLSVHQEWRGRGVGTVLIRALLDWARAHPTIEHVTLGVYATNEGAIRLYKKMGFVEEARRPKFFKNGPGEYVDDILMGVWVK